MSLAMAGKKLQIPIHITVYNIYIIWSERENVSNRQCSDWRCTAAIHEKRVVIRLQMVPRLQQSGRRRLINEDRLRVHSMTQTLGYPLNDDVEKGRLYKDGAKQWWRWGASFHEYGIKMAHVSSELLPLCKGRLACETSNTEEKRWFLERPDAMGDIIGVSCLRV